MCYHALGISLETTDSSRSDEYSEKTSIDSTNPAPREMTDEVGSLMLIQAHANPANKEN